MEENTTNVIILNRMYVGNYLGENIGHEVINLLKPDNFNEQNSYYIYINDLGNVNDNFYKTEKAKNRWIAQTILFTRWCSREYEVENKIKTQPMLEILAKVTGLTIIKDKPLNVTYGGQTLEKIFEKNTHIKKDPIYATFKATNIQKVKETTAVYILDSTPRFLDTYNAKEDKNGIIRLKEEGKDVIILNINKDKENKLNFAKQSLKQYIPDRKCKINNKDTDFSEIYTRLKDEIIENKDYWEDNNQNIKNYDELIEDKEIRIDTQDKFIEIIKQEYNELTYSNLFYHIFKSDPKLFSEFAREVLKKDLKPENIKFMREAGNIDLLIEEKTEDKKNIKSLIVIENKIKSGINGIRYSETGDETGNQLTKYIHYTYGYKVDKMGAKTYTYKEFGNKEKELKPYHNENIDRRFFIFAPNYKHFDQKKINDKINKILKHSNINKIKRNTINYEIIDYKKIYKFFDKVKDRNIPYFNEFLFALERHSHNVDNIQELQMFERFAKRIEELKN